jgi:hypothetical protein
MKQTILTLVMAALCLNLSYSQTKQKCPDQNKPQTFQYGITGFKSGYKPGFRISEHKFDKGRTIMVRNHSITRLFAIALGAGTTICDEQIILDVKEPKKLSQIHCYKLVVPSWQTDNFYTIMQQNLNAEFPGYLVAMECRNDKYFMVIKDRDDEL